MTRDVRGCFATSVYNRLDRFRSILRKQLTGHGFHAQVSMLAGMVFIAALTLVNGAGPGAQEVQSGLNNLPRGALASNERNAIGSATRELDRQGSLPVSVSAPANSHQSRPEVVHTVARQASPAAKVDVDDGLRVSLTAAERIRLRVPGFVELTGEYAVSPDDTISIAGVGRVSLRGQTARQFELTVARMLTAVLRRDVSVAAEIVRFKPYFVTGQVAQSGATEWRPGLTVIQAIALAGGTVASQNGRRGRSEQMLAREQARSHLLFSVITRARLVAEKDERSRISEVDAISELSKIGVAVETTAVQRLVEQQNETLKARTEHFESRLTALKRSKEIASSELRALISQADEIQGHLADLKKLAVLLQKLRDKKLVPNAIYLARESQLIQTRIRMSELTSLIERTRLTISTIEGNIAAAHQERQAEVYVALETVDREIAQHEVAMNSASTDDREGLSAELAYHIARKNESGTQTIKATLFSELFPGDVVVVTLAHETGGRVPPGRLSSLDQIQAIMGMATLSHDATGDRLLRNVTAR